MAAVAAATTAAVVVAAVAAVVAPTAAAVVADIIEAEARAGADLVTESTKVGRDVPRFGGIAVSIAALTLNCGALRLM